MPSTRYHRMDPEVQRRILDAARAEFLAHGYEGASINRIIQAAGINKGSLYYYFEDKSDLFLKLILAAQAEMIASAADLDLARVFRHPPSDFWSYLESASLQKVTFAIRHPDLSKLSTDFYFQATKAGAPARFKEYMAQARQQMQGLLQMGQAQGAVRSDLPLDMLTDLLIAASEIMNRPFLEDPASVEVMGPEDTRRFAAPQLDMMRRMLHPPEGGTPR